jgi:ATP synthase protein I
MTEIKNINGQNGLGQTVKDKESRKLKEKRKSKQSVLMSIGMFGLVGWSVVTPTLLGALLGIWLDRRFPGKQSWTLTLLLIGLIVGCVIAWHWLSGENKDIHKDEENEK